MSECCPKCDRELTFYPEIIGDEESKFGVYVCNNEECDNFDKAVYNSGDLE